MAEGHPAGRYRRGDPLGVSSPVAAYFGRADRQGSRRAPQEPAAIVAERGRPDGVQRGTATLDRRGLNAAAASTISDPASRGTRGDIGADPHRKRRERRNLQVALEAGLEIRLVEAELLGLLER